jgi:hypothetical protein
MRIYRSEILRSGAIVYDGATIVDTLAAIRNLGRMIVDDTTIQDSNAAGIDNHGILTLTGVTILDTRAGSRASGVFHQAGETTIESSEFSGLGVSVHAVSGTVTIRTSVITTSVYEGIRLDGGSGPAGGGIHLNVSRTAIIRNAGAAIWGRGSLITVENSTISANLTAPLYPSVAVWISGGSLDLSDSTVVSNLGTTIQTEGVLVEIQRSVVAANAGVECDFDAASTVTIDNPGFACSETPTLPLLGLDFLTEISEGSIHTFVHPILDFISPLVNTAGTGCYSPDQVGTVRPQMAGCDFGAFELPAIISSLETTPIPFSTVTPTPATGPVFTFTQQANCRKGPGTAYESLGFGQVGEQVPIQGLSDPAGWYYVQLPNAARCFAAGSTGDVSGSLDGLPVIPAPPLPVLATSTPPAPAAPTLSLNNQVCDATQYVVRLSWNNVEGEDGYRVYRDGSLIATLGANVTVYDDVSPDYNAHAYRVEAFNASGATSSATVGSEGCLY